VGSSPGDGNGGSGAGRPEQVGQEVDDVAEVRSLPIIGVQASRQAAVARALNWYPPWRCIGHVTRPL